MIQTVKRFASDIDIDFANRDEVLKVIKHIPATIVRDTGSVKHNTGIYVTNIPVDPFLESASIDYKAAEDRGYVKLDLLNVGIYSQVKNEQHLTELMHQEPAWDKLYDPDFCSKLIHIGSHYNTLIAMPEAVNTIGRMAMFLAVIRPGKRHLMGLSWQDVAKTVWETPTDGSYVFKASHSCAYAHLVAIHINLLTNFTN